MFRHDQLGVGGGCSFGLHLWDRAHPLPANFLENFSTFASGGFKHTSSIQYSENSRLWLRFVQPCRSAACKFPSKLISLYVNRISDCLDLLNKKTDAQWIVCLVLSVFKYTTMSWVPAVERLIVKGNCLSRRKGEEEGGWGVEEDHRGAHILNSRVWGGNT